MKCVILALFAAILAVGFTATTEAYEPMGVSATIQEEVEAKLTMRYDPAHATDWRHPSQPDTVETLEDGTVLATWDIRLGEPPEGFYFFFDGDLDSRTPQSKPFQVAVPVQLKRTVGMTYHITVEFGLGPPIIEVTTGRQIWYWGRGGCNWPGCNEYGEGPFPPGDWSAQAAYQSVGPGDPNDPLYGCNSRIKRDDGPWQCNEPGWKPKE